MISTTLKWVALAVLSVTLVALLGAFADIPWAALGSRDLFSSRAAVAARAIPAPPVPEPQLVKPLTAEQALAANDALPFARNALERAYAFGTGASTSDPLTQKAALDCLTAAVYYEAAGEGDRGQRAVAQVVLNRVRHPAFPARVCDVVYQGSERRTGCQFTFTCDGSLARRPGRAGWDRARKIAAEALAGFVEDSVGMATHYHADWVVPYWAPRLDKIAAVGSHIFYRWPGLWGHRQAFTQHYAGEVTQSQDMATATPLDQADGEPLELTPFQATPAGARTQFSDPISILEADQEGRQLIVDQAPRGLIADENRASLAQGDKPGPAQ